MLNLHRKYLWLIFRLCFLLGCQTPPPPQIPHQIGKVAVGHPTKIIANSRTGEMYVLSSAGSVDILQGTELVASIETGGEEPWDLAIDEVNDWLYVVNLFTENVSVIQNHELVGLVEIDARRVAVNPKNQWAYVISSSTPTEKAKLVVLQGTQRIGEIVFDDVFPQEIAIDPIEGYVYVAGGVRGSDEGFVAVIQGLQEIARYSFRFHPILLTANPQNGHVFALTALDEVVEFAQGELINQTESIAQEGQSAQNILVHPTTGDVYVLLRKPGELVRLHLFDEVQKPLNSPWAITASIQVYNTASHIAADPLSGNVYVTDYQWNELVVINGAEKIETFTTGYPFGLAVNPLNGQVYVSNANNDTVSVFGFGGE